MPERKCTVDLVLKFLALLLPVSWGMSLMALLNFRIYDCKCVLHVEAWSGPSLVSLDGRPVDSWTSH